MFFVSFLPSPGRVFPLPFAPRLSPPTAHVLFLNPITPSRNPPSTPHFLSGPLHTPTLAGPALLHNVQHPQNGHLPPEPLLAAVVFPPLLLEDDHLCGCGCVWEGDMEFGVGGWHTTRARKRERGRWDDSTPHPSTSCIHSFTSPPPPPKKERQKTIKTKKKVTIKSHLGVLRLFLHLQPHPRLIDERAPHHRVLGRAHQVHLLIGE